MDHIRKAILAVSIVDKREVDFKSTNMEKLGLNKALHELTSDGVRVGELVTDAHVQIASIFSKYALENTVGSQIQKTGVSD